MTIQVIDDRPFIDDQGQYTTTVGCVTYIDNVPYHGSGETLKEALAQLVDVIDSHGAPRVRGKNE